MNKCISKSNSIIIVLFLFLLFIGCEKKDKDMEKPIIDVSFPESFPKSCDTVYTGRSFHFIAKFSDNYALGSFSLDIHNNFDHHAHSTNIETCQMDAIKTPVNPFTFIKSFEIPEGLKQYEANVEINVPANIDAGDYHFFIMLTDFTGWSSQKGMSIKILPSQER
ncbi:MAG: DUF4625 domain-containing protein [Bacteroidales bacterium]